MKKQGVVLLVLGLISCRLVGPELCGEREEYECDGDVLVFCEASTAPLVKVDCAGLNLECNAVAQACNLCGNDDLEAGEICEDGNIIDGDGCGSTCLDTAICGNGALEANEQCDDGDDTDNNGCTNVCTLANILDCGNGTINPGEQCDNGDTIDGDGCSSTCQLEETPVFDCAQTPITVDDFNNVPPGFTFLISGDCEIGPVLLTDKNLKVKADPAGATIVGSSAFTIQGASKVIFEDVDFLVDTDAETKEIFFVQNTSKVAVVNATFQDSNDEGGERYLVCFGNSKVLLERVTMQNYAGDKAVKTENSCNLIISNSILKNGTIDNKDTLEIKSTSSVSILFSTFFQNAGTEEGIADIEDTAVANTIFNSVVGSNNGNNPVKELISPLSAFNFILGDIILGTQNIDPQINASTFQIENPAVVDRGDPNPSPNLLPFDPVSTFGINIIGHDRNNTPRSATPDPGAIETP